MEIQDRDEWNRIEAYANQKLPDNFAAAVVLRTQKQRYADRRRNTMIAVCCVCVLSVLGSTWLVKDYEALKSENQWQCLYIENEIMRTSV